jgi:rSAM/selenodomain-associated transferase 2
MTVILPVLNEAAIIRAALERLRAQLPTAQVLVVDGGSDDGSPGLARPYAPYATVLTSPPGRALQMNLGAHKASGDWLIFLHMDTRLPDGCEAALETAQRRGFEAGVFGLRIRGRHPLLPLLSMGANLRTRLRRVFLGDQALFIRKSLFLELGGFPELPLLEDYQFSRLLKRRGVPVYFSPLRVETSGRRWDVGGFFRTWWQFRRIFFHFHMSGQTDGPASQYEHTREPGQQP